MVGLLGATGPGWVIRKSSWRQTLPDTPPGRDDSPTRLNHIGPLKERGVAAHAVVKQSFIAGAGCLAEIVFVLEIHIHVTDAHDRSGDLGTESHRYALVRVNVKDKPVGWQPFHGRL